jgi:hypothetical protein
VQGIVSRFLPPELDRINSFINGSVSLNRWLQFAIFFKPKFRDLDCLLNQAVFRDELQCSLNTIMSILSGRPLLPIWKEDPLTL